MSTRPRKRSRGASWRSRSRSNRLVRQPRFRHEARLIPQVDGKRIFGFPNNIITKLRYCDSFNLTCTSGARALNVFAANGIFDPDITGVGHQPMWRDNYAAIYDQYMVIGSKITVKFANTSTTVPALCGVVGDDDTSISANVDSLMELNNSVHSLASCAGGNVVTLTQTFEPMKMFGVNAKDDGTIATSITANPTEIWCFGVWVASADQASTCTVSVSVEIDYTVKFTEVGTATQN